MDISIIAPAHRPHYWKELYSSIMKDLKLNVEFIFVGDKKPSFQLPHFTYIYSTVKPVQCVEIAFRRAKGEVIHWTSDASMYSPSALQKAYNLYKSIGSYKSLIEFRNYEGKKNKETLSQHILFNRTPIAKKYPSIMDKKYKMMPYGLISNQLLKEIGILDNRFIAGQWDNDLIMRAYAVGAKMYLCGNARVYTIYERHDGEWNLRGPMLDFESHLLKELWVDKNYRITLKRNSSLRPFIDKDILTKSQGNTGLPSIHERTYIWK